MRVFIANFGFENYMWPTCRDRPSIATLEDQDLRPFSLAGDREGYIAYCIAHKKTRAGITPTRPVASRWSNLSGIVSATEGDIWIHREKGTLWWTLSRSGSAEELLEPAYKRPESHGMYEIHKPADPWSAMNRKGAPLAWDGLHPKARAFLFTEGTLQQLADDNAKYAMALLEGEDLEPWHRRPEWAAKAEVARRGAVKVFDARERAAVTMAMTAISTAAGARGQKVERTVKVKEMRFASQEALAKYVLALMVGQEDLCALTGIALQFYGEHDDDELLCSLDRIDSDGHYEEGNLQVVCRFVNRWKSDGDNAEFQRLIGLVREMAT